MGENGDFAFAGFETQFVQAGHGGGGAAGVTGALMADAVAVDVGDESGELFLIEGRGEERPDRNSQNQDHHQNTHGHAVARFGKFQQRSGEDHGSDKAGDGEFVSAEHYPGEGRKQGQRRMAGGDIERNHQ